MTTLQVVHVLTFSNQLLANLVVYHYQSTWIDFSKDMAGPIGGAENAGVENAGVENAGGITYGKPSEQKTLKTPRV